MEERLNINVSATNYENSNKEIGNILTMVEEMVHEEDGFVMTDSEFAFGWHFYVLSINLTLVQKLANQLGEDFQRLKGKNLEKKFLTWLSKKIQEKNLKVKFAIKEEMESSKFGVF